MSTVAMACPSSYHPEIPDADEHPDRPKTQLVPTKDENKDKDYEEIDSDGSYHSDGDDLAEYWDPYRE